VLNAEEFFEIFRPSAVDEPSRLDIIDCSPVVPHFRAAPAVLLQFGSEL
jgi:hypothetical protein